MLADPFGNRLVAAAHPPDPKQRVNYLVEVCDPCLATGTRSTASRCRTSTRRATSTRCATNGHPLQLHRRDRAPAADPRGRLPHLHRSAGLGALPAARGAAEPVLLADIAALRSSSTPLRIFVDSTPQTPRVARRARPAGPIRAAERGRRRDRGIAQRRAAHGRGGLLAGRRLDEREHARRAAGAADELQRRDDEQRAGRRQLGEVGELREAVLARAEQEVVHRERRVEAAAPRPRRCPTVSTPMPTIGALLGQPARALGVRARACAAPVADVEERVLVVGARVPARAQQQPAALGQRAVLGLEGARRRRPSAGSRGPSAASARLVDHHGRADEPRGRHARPRPRRRGP